MRSAVVASTIVGWMCLVTLSACDLVGLRTCEDGACPSGTHCNSETNYCEAQGVRVLQPAQGAAVGPSVQVVAELAFSDPAATETPASLLLSAGPQQVSLSKDSDGRYSGTWTPAQEGAVTLTVSGTGMTSEEVQVTVDLTPPAFAVTAPTPFRTESGGFSDREGTAWKRDERIRVQVGAPEGIDVASVQYTLQSNIGGTPGPALALRSVVPDADAPPASYSGAMEVDLAEPEFKGFRGVVVVNVTGKDLAGNTGTGTLAIPVTRFKWTWRYPFVGSQLEPAITDDGAIWTGVRDGGDGRIFRIGADGELTELNAPGLVGGMLIADHPDDLTDGVYFTANTDGAAHAPDAGTLRVIHAGTLEGAAVCGPYAGGVYPHLALMRGNQTTGGLVHSVAFGAREDGGVLVGARIEPAAVTCVARKMAFAPLPDTDWAASYSALYLSQGTSTWRWNLTLGGWSEHPPGWPSAATVFAGMAPKEPDLYGTGEMNASGGLYVLDTEGLTGLRGSASTGPGRARPAAFDRDWIGYFGDGKGALVKADKGGQLAQVALDAGTAPVVGADGTIFAVDVNGHLSALSETLDEQWSSADAGAGANAMLLDCSRYPDGGVQPNRPGVLYVPSGSGMTAVIVDSRGMATEGWPRARHDNRNTASATTFLTPCP